MSPRLWDKCWSARARSSQRGSTDFGDSVTCVFYLMRSSTSELRIPAALAGVVISNPSRTDPIVMLKHFGPGNPRLKIL